MNISTILAVLIFAVLGPCATGPASAGSYGYSGQAPEPSESVTANGGRVVVHETLGDRMFTNFVSIYDAKTMTLLSSTRQASCCGSSWNASLDRSWDGTYSIKAQEFTGDGVYEESLTHFDAGKTPVVVGGLFLVPWLYHVTKAPQLLQINFSPIRTDLLSVSEATAEPFPESVPKSDKALEVKTSDRKTVTTLWYDPCTFTLDAYGTRGGKIEIRNALL